MISWFLKSDPGLVALSFLWIFAVIAVGEGTRRVAKLPPDVTRKVIHVGVALWALPTALYFRSPWWAALAPLVFVVLNAISYRFRLMKVIEEEGEGTPGTIYFPLSFAALILILWPFGARAASVAGLYAMGLGDVYINLKGREAHGIVEPGEEYERIRDQLVADLTAWADTATGDHPVRRLIKREDVYNGYDPDLIPDLFAANAPKYRVSWQTSLGGIPPDLLTPNNRKWSGDHCSFDAEITKGVFFANRRLDTTGATIYDLFPTILQDFGVAVPADVDGKTLAPLP